MRTDSHGKSNALSDELLLDERHVAFPIPFPLVQIDHGALDRDRAGSGEFKLAAGA